MLIAFNTPSKILTWEGICSSFGPMNDDIDIVCESVDRPDLGAAWLTLQCFDTFSGGKA